MNFLASWFVPDILYAALAVMVCLLVFVARQAWLEIKIHSAPTAASLMILAILWSLHIELGGSQLAGMNYHLLGMSLITLMLGAPAAIWLGILMLFISTLLFYDTHNLVVLGLNGLVMLLIPAIVNILMRKLTAYLPDNVFVYIFINGFIAAALGMFATGLITIILLQAANVYPTEVLWSSAFPVFFLLSWGEAFLTGIFTAIFVALAPDLLSTFSDTRYLKPNNQIWK